MTVDTSSALALPAGLRVGFALCGSFCTFAKTVPEMKRLRDAGAELTPILSEHAYETDTRFGKAAYWKQEIEQICGKSAIHSIHAAEPIGPKALLDALIVAPCTGNTLGKLAGGVTDTCVTMACKAHMRNGRPLILAISTNDGLSAAAKNIGELLARRHVYFVPFGQDDPAGKPYSLVADMTQLMPSLLRALNGEQLQPLLLRDSVCTTP